MSYEKKRPIIDHLQKHSINPWIETPFQFPIELELSTKTPDHSACALGELDHIVKLRIKEKRQERELLQTQALLKQCSPEMLKLVNTLIKKRAPVYKINVDQLQDGVSPNRETEKIQDPST